MAWHHLLDSDTCCAIAVQASSDERRHAATSGDQPLHAIAYARRHRPSRTTLEFSGPPDTPTIHALPQPCWFAELWSTPAPLVAPATATSLRCTPLMSDSGGFRSPRGRARKGDTVTSGVGKTRFCTSCGTRVLGEFLFCTECGEEILTNSGRGAVAKPATPPR